MLTCIGHPARSGCDFGQPLVRNKPARQGRMAARGHRAPLVDKALQAAKNRERPSVTDTRLNHLSVRIAVGASLVYAVIAIVFNISNGVLFLMLGPYSDLYNSPLWNLKNLVVASLILVAVLVGLVASIVSLVRHRDARLVAFLTLTLSSVGLSVRLQDFCSFLTQLLHRS